jgi:hypothetical protein
MSVRMLNNLALESYIDDETKLANARTTDIFSWGIDIPEQLKKRL